MCVIEIYGKCAWVVPLKDKKGITITGADPEILKTRGGHSMSATMVGWRRKFQVSDGLKRPK